MSSSRLQTRPSFKRSHSDLSRSTTPIPVESDSESLRTELPDFLRQSQSEIRQKWQAIETLGQQRLTSYLNSADPDDEGSLDSNHPWALDLRSEALQRNRYYDIQPWFRSRVRLRVRDGELDYINASPIRLSSTDGQQELQYIACQGPKRDGIDHFWQMVWHECKQIAVVIMLTPLIEASKEKCFQYYPSEWEPPTRPRTPLSRSSSRSGTPRSGTPPIGNMPLSPIHAQLFNPLRPSGLPRQSSFDPSTSTQPSLSLTLTSESGEPLPATVTLVDTNYNDAARTLVRKLSLTCDDEARIVYHLSFSGWQDHGIPQGPNRAAMLALIRLSKEKNDDDGTGEPGPRIVHCSAGVGRTGTFVALEHLIAELDSGAWDNWGEEKMKHYQENHAYKGDEYNYDEISSIWPDPIFDVVSRLRDQRPHMVQADRQFFFLYELMAEEWLKRRKRIIEERISLQAPSPKAIRLGQGLKKMLHIGTRGDKEKNSNDFKNAAQSGTSAPRSDSNDIAKHHVED